MSELVVETVPVKFTRRKGELTKMHKELSKLSPKMIELLAAQAYDENLDPRIRQQAMITLVKLDYEVSKAINADNMTRMLADLKYEDKLLGGKTSDDDDSSKSKKPLVDFDNIIEVEEIK